MTLNDMASVHFQACFAEYIYRNLNIPFDPATYGTKLRPATARTTAAKIEFPMGCPVRYLRLLSALRSHPGLGVPGKAWGEAR
jgi:hypothetical protein